VPLVTERFSSTTGRFCNGNICLLMQLRKAVEQLPDATGTLVSVFTGWNGIAGF
jgi:hypothetical protein